MVRTCYFGHMLMSSPSKWIYVWNRHVQRASWSICKTNRAFQRPIPVLSLQACLSFSNSTAAISVHTAARSDRTAGCPRPLLPSGCWEIYDSCRTIYIQHFICDVVCVCVSVHTCTAGGLFWLQKLSLHVFCLWLCQIVPRPLSYRASVDTIVFCPFSCTKVSPIVSHNKYFSMYKPLLHFCYCKY